MTTLLKEEYPLELTPEATTEEANKTVKPPAPAETPGQMSPATKRVIGMYLVVMGLVFIPAVIWSWTQAVATSAVDVQVVGATILGRDVAISQVLAQLLLVTSAAVVGSVVLMTLTFSMRSGKSTLEQGYVWWYLTRPVSAAGLAVLFYAAIFAGYVTIGEGETVATSAMVAAIGALAGLFTDQVMKKMRSILGQSEFDKPASTNSDVEDDGTRS